MRTEANLTHANRPDPMAYAGDLALYGSPSFSRGMSRLGNSVSAGRPAILRINLSSRSVVKALSANQISISAGSSVSTIEGVGTTQPDARMVRILCWYRRMRSAIGRSDPVLKSLSFGHSGTGISSRSTDSSSIARPCHWQKASSGRIHQPAKSVDVSLRRSLPDTAA